MNKKIIGIFVCMLFMLQLGTIVSAESNQDYNLKVKIDSFKRLHTNHGGYCKFLVKVSNEGPGTSNNYTCHVDIFSLPSLCSIIKDWFHWDPIWYSYTGSQLAANSYEETVVNLYFPPQGWYIVRATINSDDNYIYDNVSYCIYWVNYN